MKSLLFILSICLIGISYAELPDVLKDPAAREVAEYLDAKAQAAEKVTRNFSVATATTSFSGWIDIGLEIVNANFSVSGTVSCSAGKRVTGGGVACTSNAASNNSPSGTTGWTGTCASGNGTVYAICARVK